MDTDCFKDAMSGVSLYNSNCGRERAITERKSAEGNRHLRIEQVRKGRDANSTRATQTCTGRATTQLLALVKTVQLLAMFKTVQLVQHNLKEQ